MKKRQIPPFVLLFFVSFIPMLTLVCYCFGYSVYLTKFRLISIIYALAFIAVGVLIFKKNVVCKALVFLPVLSLVNLTVCAFKSSSAVVLVCLCACFICSTVLAVKNCSSLKTKTLSAVTSALSAVPVIVVALAVVLFADFGKNTVVKKINSPGNNFCAEIIDSDQGALGGNTVVYVHKNGELNLIFLTISKTPQRVYIGEWKEYESMLIFWKNESCLLINSEEYNIEN